MKSHADYLTMNVLERLAFVNITPQVAEAVQDSSVKEGLALVNRKRRIVLAVQPSE
jgi:thiamine phosphate synthase YjbQ (UPF0047 family)